MDQCLDKSYEVDEKGPATLPTNDEQNPKISKAESLAAIGLIITLAAGLFTIGKFLFGGKVDAGVAANSLPSLKG